MSRRKAWWYIGIAYIIVVLVLVGVWRAGIRQWGDVFSLGQLLVDAVLLPIAIIGFIMAAEEFREARASPILDLHWQVGPGRIEKEIELRVPLPTDVQLEQVVHDRGVRPVLINSGKAIAVWYMIGFDVPREICEHKLLRGAGESWDRQLGEKANWRQEIWPEKLRVVFLSNGEIACYPRYPLPLGILNLAIAADKQPKEYQVPYTIVTDRGHTTEGYLLIKFKWEPSK